jgi:ABC-type transport system substrate-binding protein
MAESIKEDLEKNLDVTVTIDSYSWSDYMSSVRYNYYTGAMYLMGYCLDFGMRKTCGIAGWIQISFPTWPICAGPMLISRTRCSKRKPL